MISKRNIRMSGYNDYVAIDLLDEHGKIIQTQLYLKKGESKKCKIRWDFDVWTGLQTFNQSSMVDGEIRFTGNKPEATFKDTQSGEYWWEPTEYELLSKSIFHF